MGTAEAREAFAEWAILELMGHRRLAGRVTEATIAGGAFLRLDVVTDCPDCGSGGDVERGSGKADCKPCDGNGTRTVATQFYSPAAVYCITPTTPAIAMDIAERDRPAPVQPWELPARVPDLDAMVRRGREIDAEANGDGA